MTAATPSTSIPDSHRDCVLNAFLQGHTIPVLAEHYKLPITAIVAFLNSPEIQSLRDDIAQLAASQAELATTHARTASILTLHAVINGQSIDPAQVRAASALLRNTPKAPPRAPHGAVGSPHVSKGSAPQPQDTAHSSPHADVRPNSRTNARADSRASRRRHEPENDSHHEPAVERETATAHNDTGASHHARDEHATDEANPTTARHQTSDDARALDTRHDQAAPTDYQNADSVRARDRPKAAA